MTDAAVQTSSDVGAPGPDEEVEARVRRYIVEHGLRPGDRLPTEAEWASSLGTSRVVVREALRGLEAIGVIEARAGSGRYLRGFDLATAARAFAHSLAFHPGALTDLRVARVALESELMISSAGRIAAADLDALEALVERMRRRVATGDTGLNAEDRVFHTLLMRAGGNAIAMALEELYWRVMDRLYTSGFPTLALADAPYVVETHGRIVAALRRGDALEAGQLLRTHGREAERRFVAWESGLSPHRGDGTSGAVQAAVYAALLGPDATKVPSPSGDPE